MHLYITHALYVEIYTTLIQLMSIAGYEAYVCVCFFVYKILCSAFIRLPWEDRSCPYVCLYRVKKLFNQRYLPILAFHVASNVRYKEFRSVKYNVRRSSLKLCARFLVVARQLRIATSAFLTKGYGTPLVDAVCEILHAPKCFFGDVYPSMP